MKKLAFLLLPITCYLLPVQASDTLTVSRARFVGPLTVQAPIVLDSVTLDHKKYSADQVIDTKVSFEALDKSPYKDIKSLPLKGELEGGSTLHLLQITIVNTSYSNVEVKVDRAKFSKVFFGDEECSSKKLSPGQYDITVKFVADSVSPTVKVISDKTGAVAFKAEGTKRAFNLDDNMEMKYYRQAALSPSGKYLAYGYSYFNNEGKTQRVYRIMELASGRILAESSKPYSWMPFDKLRTSHKTDRYYFVKDENGHKNLYAASASEGREELMARDLPDDDVTIAPNGEYLLYSIFNEGPKKQEGVFEVYTPDDRQPDYRGRYTIGKYDMKTGLSEPLTYGRHNTSVLDISADSKYLLFMTMVDSIRQRPSTVFNIYRLNMETMQVETLVDKDGFVADARFFPGTADRIIVKGTPEAFGGIGNILPEDRIPSMYDYLLFAMDVPSRKVTPLKDFEPSIEELYPSDCDKMIYFTAENKDSVCVYRLNPKDLSIRMVAQPTAVVSGLTIAENAPLMIVYGASPCQTDRLYSVTLAGRQKVSLIEDLNRDRMADIQLGTCHDMSFTCSRGYKVTGFYYLPANFDATKKYPMIVDYYGGCSPTSKRFGGGSHYPSHYWNALGYVVLIVNPSGASGFGQEWASRHVNTAAEGVAEDIIEATEWMADHNAFINKSKIGCVSASYGGFMTQVLLSKTDLYACGISHAGISSHTSYWGEGYWGHSYSEVSMAKSYPWTRKDLYVERSPIYNADKIHRPILFTHGTADTNVPIGESIQMYTAMKILGVPTAFVMVEGENHGIMDYAKRKKWINTMASWFQRWLQDDDSWWYGMYPKVEE